MRIDRLREGVVSILFPRRCPVCDGIVRQGEGYIHVGCRKKIKFVSGPTCMKCGKPLRDSCQEYCEDCRRIKHLFDRGFSVFSYRSVTGSIYRFKYAGRKEYADYYGEAAGMVLGSKLRKLGADAIIPVPMYKPKERRRGYNQAEVFADVLGKMLGIPVYPDVIKRVKNTVPMKLLDERQRRTNLKKAFIIRKNDVKFKCIILVDDIYTTGSTLDEVSREFRRMGVERIYAVTLAIGQVV